MEDKIYSLEFLLENTEAHDDEFFFTAKSLTTDFAPQEALPLLAADSINKPLIWRHKHPIDPEYKKYPIFGKVVKSWVEENYILSKYEVYGHTPAHRRLRLEIANSVKENVPLKISMRFRLYTNEANKPIHCDVFEHSNTPNPVCTECKILDFTNEEKIMPEEKEILEQVKKLEESLEAKEKLLEGFKTKIETLEAQLIEKVDEVKTKDEELQCQKKSFEEKILELDSKLDYLDKKPILDKIFEAEGKTVLTEIYKEKSKKFLLDRLEEVEKAAAAVKTQSLEQSAKEAKEKEEKELEEVSVDKAYGGIKDMVEAAKKAAKEHKAW